MELSHVVPFVPNCASIAKTTKRASRDIRRAAVVKALMDCDWSVALAASRTGEQPRFVKKWQDHYLLHKNVADKARMGRKEILTKSQQDIIPVLFAEQQCISKVKAILVSQHGVPTVRLPLNYIQGSKKSRWTGQHPQKSPC